MWVVYGGLPGCVGVGGGDVLVCWGHRGDWVCLVYLEVGYAIAGCAVEAMCGREWVPRFALEYVELVVPGSYGFYVRGWLCGLLMVVVC